MLDKMLYRKPFAAVAEENEGGLKRSLGAFDLTVLGIEVKGDGGLLFGLAVTVFVCSAIVEIRISGLPSSSSTKGAMEPNG